MAFSWLFWILVWLFEIFFIIWLFLTIFFVDFVSELGSVQLNTWHELWCWFYLKLDELVYINGGITISHALVLCFYNEKHVHLWEFNISRLLVSVFSWWKTRSPTRMLRKKYFKVHVFIFITNFVLSIWFILGFVNSNKLLLSKYNHMDSVYIKFTSPEFSAASSVFFSSTIMFIFC